MSDTKNNQKQIFHWADQVAEKIIREKGDKETYTVASGITPSGVVHFGNFREVITVDLVARALIQKGKKVRFIYSWDDYDTFRKVPANMPKQEELKELLYQPIVDVPDPFDEYSSYAEHNEKVFEKDLPKVGIDYVEFIYQNKKYRAGDYNENIIHIMDNKDKVGEILQQFRTSELEEDWAPLLTYCEKCNRDRISITGYDKKTKTITYKCELCGFEGKEDLKTSKRLKLPWRIDWPMRWAYEGVDFEPGGRDHSSAGGSRDTASIIINQIFDKDAPVYVAYDNIGIKGFNGKISSSKGNVITLKEILDVYEPEMVRWIFSSYRPNAAFDLAFDLDVLKNYEDFDRLERTVYGLENVKEEKLLTAKRIYELSQLNTDGKIPDVIPFQPSFRHLCNILQINDFNIAKARKYYEAEIKNERDERRFNERAERAVFWIKNHAPEDFKFIINKEKRSDIKLSDIEAKFVKALHNELSENWDNYQTDKELQNKIGNMVSEFGLTPDIYKKLYQILINRDLGPKLAGFIRSIGKEKILNLF